MRTFKGALVLLDYPNQPFVVTQPQGSTVFGNPSAEASASRATQVAQFYEDFLNTPERSSTAGTRCTSTGWRTPAAATAST